MCDKPSPAKNGGFLQCLASVFTRSRNKMCRGKAAARTDMAPAPSCVSLARREVVVWMRAAETVPMAARITLTLSIERCSHLVLHRLRRSGTATRERLSGSLRAMRALNSPIEFKRTGPGIKNRDQPTVRTPYGELTCKLLVV
jgi:hypothetical protein